MLYSTRSRLLLLVSASTAVGLLRPGVASANPQFTQPTATASLLNDNFSGGFGNWSIDTNTVGRTVFGQTPTLVTNGTGTVSTYAKLQVQTYDPTADPTGTYLLGTQLHTDQTYSLPTTSAGTASGAGIQFQITARVESTGLSGATSVATPQGLNAASFAYGYNGGSPNYLNEIDVENLTSQQSATKTTSNPYGKTGHANSVLGTGTGDATLLTSYNTTASGSADNSYYAQTPYASGDTGTTATPVNIYQWHTYDIDWFPKQIDWYVDGQLVREEAAGETSTSNPTLYIPNQPMAFYLNFWAPASTFSDAYSSKLAAATTSAGNQTFYDDVADAEVNTLAAVDAATPEPTTCLTVGGAVAALLGLGRPARRRRA